MRNDVIYEGYKGTYAKQDSKMVTKEYGWNHGLSKLINALTEAGLQIDYLKEYDDNPYDLLPNLAKTNSGIFVTEDKLYPLIFNLKSNKI